MFHWVSLETKNLKKLKVQLIKQEGILILSDSYSGIYDIILLLLLLLQLTFAFMLINTNITLYFKLYTNNELIVGGTFTDFKYIFRWLPSIKAACP